MRFLALGAILVLAAACSPAAPPTASTTTTNTNTEQKATNQVLRIAKQSLPPAFSPEATNISNEMFNPAYDALIRFGSNQELLPGVAEKWEIVNNNWRFTIRQDLTFSNGDKLTADDVVFSTNLIVEKNTPTRAYLPLVTGAKKLDDKTVEIDTKQLDATVPYGAPWIYILPKAYYEKVGTAEFGQKPVGSGPYEVTSFNNATSAILKLRSTPHPYRKPTATELRFIAVPEVGQQVVGLRTGELDFALSTFTTEQIDQLKANGLAVANRSVSVTTALFSQPEAEARNSPLKDKRVRQALNYALDKDGMINALFKGMGQPASQLPLLNSTAFNNNLKPYPYDPAKAKQLLADAGYPNGVKLPKGIGFTPQTTLPAIATIIQDNLRSVGVEAAINPYEYAVFLDQYYGRGNNQKDDLFLTTGGDPNGTFSLIRGQYGCDKEGFATWFCVPEFVKLYDQSSSETDPQKRSQLLQQSVAALMDEAPVLLLYYKDGTAVMTSDLRGFVWPMPTWYDFDTVYRVG
jgi:peptide/nickel transport system substrate-binding protein